MHYLPKYTVTIRVSDPSDSDAFAEASFESCPREAVMKHSLISAVVSAFESSMEDGL